MTALMTSPFSPIGSISPVAPITPTTSPMGDRAAMTPAGVLDLAPISLAELVERAALLSRVDRKYVVSLAEAQNLVTDIAGQARVLEIDGRREFGYSSTYFDTARRESFLTAGRSQRRRWKVRTRTYLDSELTWLEIKTRAARGQTLKQRIEHPESGRISPTGADFVAEILGERIARTIAPALITDYHRTTLFLGESSSRVTMDVDLGWTSLVDGTTFNRQRLAIVETKTGSTPSAMDRLLWSRGHRPVQISKYGVGMAALDPELPRLKWHRVMTRDLALDHPGDLC